MTDACSFCGRPHAEVDRLLGFTPNYICGECIGVARDALAAPDTRDCVIGLDGADPSPDRDCSFCGRWAAEAEGLVVGATAGICRRCVDEVDPNFWTRG